jgi:uroporphyrinogen-III decarboxylase
MKITIAPAKNLSNNRNPHLIGFKDISPQWFEKLNKILDEGNNKKENEDEIIHKLYHEINSYEKCVVGEAYGYDSSYVIEGTRKRCQQCVALSGNFSYYLRLFDKQKIIETIDEFTKHWNKQHKDVIMSNTYLLAN